MAVISVDLAARRYADMGIAVLRRVDGIVDVDFLRPDELHLGGTPAPDALACKLASLAHETEAQLILLDGPQGWRAAESVIPHMRQCERETRTPGKTGVPPVVKPASWTRMVRFSVAVFDSLHDAGWSRFAGKWSGERCAVETFPTHAWRVLGLEPLPAKHRHPAVDDWVVRLERVVKLRWPRRPSHDELQAVVAGLGGLLLIHRGVAACDVRGRAPFDDAGFWREGFILSAGAAG